MNSPSAELTISGMMLLAGAATFVFSRSPQIGILLRPLSWSLGLFGLGIWALFGASLAGTQSSVVPLAMSLSIVWGIRTERAPVPVVARKLGARFVSIGFLILLGISDDLAVLFFASEAASLSMLAEHSWESPLPVRRRLLLVRSLGSLFLLAAGVTSIAAFAGTASLGSIETQLSDRWERAGSLMQNARAGSELLQMGLILMVSGAAWKLSFFPFSSPGKGTERESLSSEAQVVRVFSVTILLAVVIPRLAGEFEISQILLLTFGLLTFVRATLRAIRAEFLDDSLRNLLNASAALIWVILAVGLQGSGAGRETTEGFLFPGEEILIFELTSALAAFLLLGLAIERESAGDGRHLRRERLSGMLHRAPVAALLSMFLILLWTGLFAVRGRWALMFEGLQIAASNQSAARGYFLVSLVVLACLCLQQLFALQLCQMICTRGWSSRTVSPRVPVQNDNPPLPPRQAVVQSSSNH